MKKQETDTTMTELLRAALADAESLSEIQRATGLKRQSLAKFMRCEQSLRLDMADKLAAYFKVVVSFPKGKHP